MYQSVRLRWLALELALGQRVDEFHVAGADAITGVTQIKHGVCHALRAAGKDHVGVSRHDFHGAVLHGRHAGGALAHHSVRGAFIGDAHPQRGDTGDVGLVRGLAALAHDHLVDLLGIDAGAGQAPLQDGLGQVDGVQRLQGSAHIADSGAAAVDDDDFSHFFQHRYFRLLS